MIPRWAVAVNPCPKNGVFMPRKIRPIRVEGNIAYITLTQGHIATIDAADVPLVEGFNWYARCKYRRDGSLRTAYAARSIREIRRVILLHREIMQPPDNMQVDHIDGDGLDNRRANMRIVTRQQNQRNMRTPCNNSSGAKGVSWHYQTKKWQAHIRLNGKGHYLGLFYSIQEAAAAYAAASKKYHGVWGRVE